jgi:hypothetical protein
MLSVYVHEYDRMTFCDGSVGFCADRWCKPHCRGNRIGPQVAARNSRNLWWTATADSVNGKNLVGSKTVRKRNTRVIPCRRKTIVPRETTEHERRPGHGTRNGIGHLDRFFEGSTCGRGRVREKRNRVVRQEHEKRFVMTDPRRRQVCPS